MLLACTYFLNQDSYYKSEGKINHIILSSGPRGSVYYENGNYLKNLLNPVIKPAVIENIPSDGSYENFDRLESLKADLILAQRNVAIEKYFDKDNAFKNFEVMLPLFKEAVQIIVKDTSIHQTITFNDFENRIRKGIIKKISVGPKGSTTNKIFNELLSCISDSTLPSSLKFDERQLDLALNDFENGDIDCMVDFSAPPFRKFVNQGLYFSLVTFNKEQIDLLTSYFKELDTINFSSEIYFGDTLNKEEIYTIGTWAFLIGTPSVYKLLPEKTKLISDIIIADIYKNNPNNSISKVYKEDLKLIQKNNGFSIHPDREINMDKFFQGMPLSNGVKEIYGFSKITGTEIVIIIIAILLLFYLYYFHINNFLLFFKRKPKDFRLKFVKFKNRYGHWLLTLVITFFLLLALSFLIQFVELRNYKIYGIKSPILNLGIIDTLEWLMIDMFTHHEANIFPLSTWGRFLTTLTFALEGGVIIAPLVFQYYINNKIKNRMTGKRKISVDGHIVICGWNESVYLLANALLKTDHNFAYQEKGQNISKVILVNTAYENIDDHVMDERQEEFKTNLQNGFIEFYFGDPADISVLDDLEIYMAKRVIIVSKGKGRKSDERVLLTAHAVSAHCKEIWNNEKMETKQTHRKNVSKHHHSKQPYMVAEVYDPAFIKSLEEAGVNVIISTGELANNLILQDVVCPGIYNPIRNLIQYDDESNDNNTNDFYTIKVSKHPELTGKTFDQLYPLLRKSKLQLIGFKKIFIDGDGVIFDSHEIKKRLIAKNLKSDYIINPQTKEEIIEMTEANDEIIVLALDKEHLKNLIG